MLQGSERQDFAASHAPVAPLTWELRAELANDAESTGEVPIRFSRPVELLGLKAIVTPVRPLAGGGLIVPTVDDINVELISDNTDLWTRKLGESGSEGTFAPLSGLSVDAPRLLRIVPKGDAPDFAFTFEWDQFLSGTKFFESAIIRLAIFARYITEEERDAWWAANEIRKVK